MKIGIDYTVALKQRGGIGRITRGLIAGVAALDPQNQYLLLCANDTAAFSPPAPNFSARRLPLSERMLNIMWHRLHVPLPIEQFAGSVDVFHAPNFTLPPTNTPLRIVTIHDLTFLRYPAGAMPSLRQFLSRAVPSAARRATQIIADSQATKDDLIDWLKLPAEKISVVYAGVDERFKPITDEAGRERVRAKYDLHRPFILGLGTLEPRKNFVGLIRAFERLQLPDHELVIVGRPGWLHEPIIEAARAVQNVRLLGFVEDDDLPALYSLASLYCLPSYYEGFGIPCIEAMACGTPVVCSDRPCLPEIVGPLTSFIPAPPQAGAQSARQGHGQAAALIVAPDDIDALADTLLKTLTDSTLRQTLIERGLARAKEFPWSRGARDLLNVYEHVGRIRQ